MKKAQLIEQFVKGINSKHPTAGRFMLNLFLPQIIPFNAPHGLKVLQLTPGEARVALPFKRANKNHLGGLHAAALATVGEFTAGILILRHINFSKQRLVLKNLTCEYKKQGRETALARTIWPKELPNNPEEFQNSQETIDIPMQTVICNSEGAELAQVSTLWQVKPWSKVRTSTKKRENHES